MKIAILILLTTCTLLNAEYPRYKIRGPPHQRRVSPSQQFAKKWHQQSQYPSRNPVRSRPIPVHMPSSHKMPMGMPQGPKRAVAPPVRTFWKNTQANNKYPQEKPYKPPQEKPFLAAPSVNTQEYDYHIQANSIPTMHTNPIKQVGEKGPIHTIPAPNLSLRDKPIIVEEVKYHQPTTNHQPPYLKVEQSHQYQVTEQPENMPNQPLYRAQQQLLQQHQQQFQQQQQLQQQQQQQQQLQQQQQQQFQQQQQIQNQQQQLQIPQQPHQLHMQQEQLLQQEIQKQVEIQPQQLYYTTDTMALPKAQKAPNGEIYLSSQLNPKELYQIIGAAYPQQVQNSDMQSFYQPAQQNQQIQNYEPLSPEQLYQAEQSQFLQLQPTEDTSNKVSIQPEFHSFNYDEQAHQKSQKGLTKKELSKLVTAAYNLDSNLPPTNQISARISVDPEAQAQLIQSYFDTRSDVDVNDVEPDAKPSSDQANQSEVIKEELLSSSYFSSLPNKEAADRLADLQAAGKINSSLMKLASNNNHSKDTAAIFVPDNYEGKEQDGENYPDSSNEQLVEYDEDYSQDENGASEEDSKEFGQKMASKGN